MPLNRLLRDSKLEPKEIERLNVAFTHALRLLSLVDRSDPLAEYVARTIIKVGSTGIRDPMEIARVAVKQLNVS